MVLTPGEAIDQAANEVAPGDEQFRLIMHAIAMAESGGNPNIVGDNGQSIGLFQNRMVYGRGANYSAQQLSDPLFNSRLAAKELVRYYQQGVKAGLTGKQLATYVSKYGQRPAPGNEVAAGQHYGEYVKGSRGPVNQQAKTVQVPELVVTPQQQSNFYNDFINKWKNMVPKVQAAELSSTRPWVNPITQPYTVRSGDTLWGIAEQYLGNGNLWPTLSGYSGEPTKMPVGTNINIPVQTPNKIPMSSSTNTSAANYIPVAYSAQGAPYSPANYKPPTSTSAASTNSFTNQYQTPAAYPIASMADGRIKYSDGSIR